MDHKISNIERIICNGQPTSNGELPKSIKAILAEDSIFSWKIQESTLHFGYGSRAIHHEDLIPHPNEGVIRGYTYEKRYLGYMIDPILGTKIKSLGKRKARPEIQKFLTNIITFSDFLIRNGFPSEYELTSFTRKFLYEAGKAIKDKQLVKNTPQMLGQIVR
jgi:hypothetical protein